MDLLRKQLEERIKECQLKLIENTIDLDENLRTKLYNKFNGLKYKIITKDEALKFVSEGTIAFYSQSDRCINLIEGGMDNLEHILLHEMIHAVTDKAESPDILTTIGYSNYEIYNIDSYSIIYLNRAITEAATEFYTINFLQMSTVSSYPLIVNIYGYLSDKCGYSKLKECFFNCDINKFKSIVIDTFHLPNSILIDQLIDQVQVIELNSDTFILTKKQMMSFSQCLLTLAQMNYYKLKFENPTFTKEEINNLINIDDICKIISNNNKLFRFSDWPHLIKKHLNDEISNFSTLKTKSKDKELVRKYTHQMICKILSQKPLNETYLNFAKIYLADVLMQFYQMPAVIEKPNNLYDINGIVKKFIKQLSSEDGKIDLSNLNDIDKNRAMSLIIFGPISMDKDFVDIFTKKDMINFVNYGRNNISGFYDEKSATTILLNKDLLKQYIKNESVFYKSIKDKFDHLIDGEKTFDK